jgi:prophage DNA circulation protein
MLTIETSKETTDTALAEETSPTVSESLKDIYSSFTEISVSELENAIVAANDRDEKVLYRTLLNLKLQLDQEKIINQTLL